MSRICPSCGGVLGRDCFNPRECAEITQLLEYDQYRQSQPHPESTPPEKTYSEEEVMELITAFKISETYPMPVAEVKDEFTNLFKANLVKVKNWFKEVNKQ